MPKNTTIQSILVIGSGPIIIGQAAEFDYAGTQACMALKEEGYRVILVNNNPATIMTDAMQADAVYFEPLTVEAVEKIIEKEQPDGLLATLGGQTGLNLAYELESNGILERFGVKLLGTSIDSIIKGEDREAFRQLMYELGEPVPESKVVHTIEEGRSFAEDIGFPIIVRPAYTLGGTGGGIAHQMEEFLQLLKGGLKESAIGQCLVERSIAGFKEIEYEVMRDSENTCITICNMENIDPVGIHTGDSIVVAPTQTLTEEECALLKKAAIKIISALEIIGGCNIQFALDPQSNKYYLIEVNPRVSRSSALASKATGYPIARIAAKLAVGYTLSELMNPVTGGLSANWEPKLDYIVVKFPRWAFDKFPHIDRKLGTQMKATGEVMGIDKSFERALQKAVHSLEITNDGLKLRHLKTMSVDQLFDDIHKQTDERFFVILELLRRGVQIDTIHEKTTIDLFFLHLFLKLIKLERDIAETRFDYVSKEQLKLYKEKGFSDQYLASEWKVSERAVREKRIKYGVVPSYKKVDTCAGQFPSNSNYYYSCYFGENEQKSSTKRKVLIIGSGPIRIGQGIEFDYCSVHGVYALQEENIETILINNNPETVSTDFATADRLYFESLLIEDILNVIETEGVTEVIVQLGGQTALNMAKQLESYGVRLLGPAANVIDTLEDRAKFYRLLDELNIPHINGYTVNNEKQLYEAIEKVGFPVLIRPSYVIGGKGMEIVSDQEHLQKLLNNQFIHYPILVDQYLDAMEAELDLVADGTDVYIPTIIEHIENTGVHSGDSMCVMPPLTISANIVDKMTYYSQLIVKELHYKGLMNIQFIIDGENVYILEVNPRASRTIPIVSKVTGVPLVQIATKLWLNQSKIEDMMKDKQMNLPFMCIKYPVFSTYALNGLDSKTGPEMKSTGEGISIAESYEEALYKSFFPIIKNLPVRKQVIYACDEVNIKTEQLVKKLGIELIKTDASFKSLYDKNTIAVVSTNNEHKDYMLRTEAIKLRLPVFSRHETFNAFLSAFTKKEMTVRSIENWLLLNEKGVNIG
ncbi:carbamoyl phosphate synthase large subunit [Bacillus aquiflavi]|uniref:Carbamoyl phosphate synthase large chain n=1 Tax=Bacillus aquiflavi TaxID=2672567 RepID=A0A6B3VRB9_9BACI|nr:carbamoyl phosphate synthase large subunit [Bacillus aquiflavi]MBA4536472.1 carbamoyl phosphate synthase large subunit [Bacillus aquiflavi]NEY80840.1 carbamoyl phosphate synthase large subunit [Bacillus aquiflavi]UAC49070.1 carbamoyl phosphate synthase large subunit [Bacillus aquiflavi]